MDICAYAERPLRDEGVAVGLPSTRKLKSLNREGKGEVNVLQHAPQFTSVALVYGHLRGPLKSTIQAVYPCVPN